MCDHSHKLRHTIDKNKYYKYFKISKFYLAMLFIHFNDIILFMQWELIKKYILFLKNEECKIRPRNK